MAKDIKIIWDENLQEGDIVFSNGDLVLDEGLDTAAIVSVFTDRRAEDDDELDNPDDRRGWWGDLTTDQDQIGSRLWELSRAKTTQENLLKTEEFVNEALQWMIDDGVAQNLEIEAERQGDVGNERLAFKATILKKDGNEEAFTFDDLWNNQFGLGV